MIRKAEDMSTEVRASMRGGIGSVTIQHLFKPEELTAKSRLCARLLVPPGASIGTHRHDGEDEVYIILKGQGLLDDGKSQTAVQAGDAILTGNGESHAITNNGSGDLELIAVIMLYS